MDLNNQHISNEPTGDITTLDLEADVIANHDVGKGSKENSKEGKDFDLLGDMLETSKQIEVAATKDVVSLPPIITLEDLHIIKRNSINLIQGSYGSHKSRFAENLVAMLIADENCTTDFFGLEKNPNEIFSVAYIDTERNTKDELPRVLQNIRRLAGQNPRKRHGKLHMHTIKKYDRSIRQKATQTILRKIRQDVKEHLVVVLDVITDCLKSFNNEEASLKLYDFLGNLCEEHDCTVIAVIHENPGSNKARGHAGSEGGNKSSTLFRIGYEKDQGDNESDIIKLEFLKLRHGKKPVPIYLRFCEETFNLIQATKEELEAAGITSSSASSTEEFSILVSEAFNDQDSLSRSELIGYFKEKTGKSERTIEKNIKKLINNEEAWITNKSGELCTLCKKGSQGKSVSYFLNNTL